MARIATIETRLGSLRTAAEPSFDAALTAELGGGPGADPSVTGGDGSPPSGSGSGSATTDPQTMASYLALMGNQATGAGAGTVTLGSWTGGSAPGGASATSAWTSAAASTPTSAVPALSGTIVAAVPRAPGAYATLQPPAALVAYGNGTIPAEALAPIGVGRHRLHAPAAAAFQQMSADAAAQGVAIGVTDSYRSYDQQVDLARRKGLYSQGGLAATPGTSNHGWGLALDLDLDASAQSWMDEHGWRYGFVESVPREPWHWEYRPAGSGS